MGENRNKDRGSKADQGRQGGEDNALQDREQAGRGARSGVEDAERQPRKSAGDGELAREGGAGEGMSRAKRQRKDQGRTDASKKSGRHPEGR